MKLIIAGGRDFDDYNLVWREVNKLNELTPITAVISGLARGADTLGMVWAGDTNTPVVGMPADWNLHGRSAGYKRNVEMAKIADACICFWDGQSRGTKHMIDIATERGLPLTVVRY